MTVQEPVIYERSYRTGVEPLWELWTTKDGFESWWGPQGFRVDVHRMEARLGGVVEYDMVANSPEMVAAMKAAGQAVLHKRWAIIPGSSRWSALRLCTSSISSPASTPMKR